MLNGFQTSAAADLAYAAHVSSLLAKHTRYIAQFHRFTPYYNAKTYHRTTYRLADLDLSSEHAVA
jgi:hypothetical protein